MGNNTTPICQCPNCRNIGKYAFPVRRRGMNNAYLCEFHKNSLESYYSKNDTRIGNMKANGMTYSIELEVMRPQFQARLELCLAGFLPTSDCTVDAEFKSPIYNGANALKAYFDSIQWMLDNELIVIDEHCGTHFHVGNVNYINENTIHFIRRFYHSLFVPLSEACENNDALATDIFGRGFQRWNHAIHYGCDAEEHTNFINVQHDCTIEFRRMFFKNAKQYSRGCDFCRKVVEIVCDTFCVEVYKRNLTIGAALTAEDKAALKKAADKAAKKMVKEFYKA